MATNLGTPQNWSPVAPSGTGGMTVQDLMNSLQNGQQQTVDLQSLMPHITQAQNTSPSAGPFTASMFPSNPTPLVTQAQQSAKQGLMGLLHDIGNAVSPVYNDISAGLHGWNTNGFQGMVNGFLHPAQEQQAYQQHLQDVLSTESNPVQRAVTRGIYDTASSPLTYIPGAVVTKPLGMVAKATGITPAAKFLTDLVKGTVKSGADATPAVADGAQAFDNLVKPTEPNQGGLLGFLDNAKPAEVPTQAGLLGTLESAPTTVANIAKTGAYKTQQQAANDLLNQVFNIGRENGLPAGREPEALQGILSSIAPKTGVSLNDLIDKSTQFKNISDLIPKAQTRNAVGLTGDVLAPQAFKQGTKDVLKTIAPEAGSVTEGGLLNVIPSGSPVANDAVQGGLMNVVPNGAEIPSAVGQAAQDTHPYATNDWQAAVGAPIAQALQNMAPNGVPVAKHILNAAQNAFTTLPGTTKAFKNFFSQYFGEKASGANDINNFLASVFKGTTPEQRAEFINLLESTAPGTTFQDPVMERMRQQVEPRMEEALQNAQARGLINKTINPADYGVARYVPHVFAKGSPKVEAGTADGGLFLRKGVDANKDRTLKGTIQQLNQQAHASNGAAPSFETDAIKVLGHYFHQLNEAGSAQNLIDKAVGNGVMKDVHPETNTATVPFQDSTGKTSLIPKAEADILNGLGTKQQEGVFSKSYRKVTNGLNKLMFASNPFMHVVNNLGFQTAIHHPALFKDVVNHIPEALSGIQPGSEMDRALKAGALNLGSEVGARGIGINKQLDQLISKVDGTGSSVKSEISRYNHLTPDIEKAYRTAAFSHAIKGGMSDADAANYVRSIFGGHIAPNTMSGAERALTMMLPFGNWTKTALVSNAKNFMKHPAPYVAIAQTANALNTEATGHGMMQNPNSAAIGIPGAKNAQGRQKYYTPYFPAWDLIKLASQMGQQGVGQGSLNFAWSRLNPALKMAGQLISHEQNPVAPVADKYNIVSYPYLQGGASNPYNAQGIFFGGKGPKANPYVAQMMQDMTIPGAETAYNFATQPIGQVLAQLGIGATGGSVSAPNPQAALKEQQYQQKMAKSQLKSAMRKAVQNQNGG